eukprot:GHVT01012211.1.p1 GENE.GHVT01012211.1~~GHVT01012211.1.p1  ORF type:complete len:244 (+),score=33.98 GHVT01012211.1:517-1248(+)
MLPPSVPNESRPSRLAPEPLPLAVPSGGNPKPFAPATGDTMEGVIQEIQAVLPQCSRGQIENALLRANFDKDKAIDMLINDIVVAASHSQTAEQFHASSPAVAAASGPSWGAYHDAPAPAAFPHGTYGTASIVGQAPGTIKPSGRKKALLIGINYFNTSSRLNGCISDVRRMRQTIVAIFGFPDNENSLVCLTDDSRDPNYRPTRHNILTACRWLSCDAREGDCLFFHYSGHGGQMADPTVRN